jgi:hypothetical protein
MLCPLSFSLHDADKHGKIKYAIWKNLKLEREIWPLQSIAESPRSWLWQTSMSAFGQERTFAAPTSNVRYSPEGGHRFRC